MYMYSIKNSTTFLVLALLVSACNMMNKTANNGAGSIEELLVRTVKQQPMPQRVDKLAFGSCIHQDKALLAFPLIVAEKHDIFLFLGDNIYGDTRDMKILAAKYSKLGARPEFEELMKTCPLLATWDDHDYGENDAGREYPQKESSKRLFMAFWGDESDSPRHQHKGIYNVYNIGSSGHQLQIILLDLRTFRSPLLSNNNAKLYRNSYRPNEDNSATMLGDEQWAWLKKQLLEPADLRIIASSTQFGATYNGYEAWANFPKEKEKMLALIKETKAEGLFFLSGDTHWAELSKLETEGLYPIYDLTSSGINRDWPHVEKNDNRVGEACSRFNYGVIEIDWANKAFTFRITDAYDKLQLEHEVKFSELNF